MKMHHITFLTVLALVGCITLATGQNSELMKTDRKEISKRLEILADAKKKSSLVDRRRSELIELIVPSNYDSIISLLHDFPRQDKPTQFSLRGLLYTEISNAKRYDLSDVIFLTRVFNFIVQESEAATDAGADKGEFQYARFSDEAALPMVAGSIAIALGQESLFNDRNRTMLRTDPRQWLRQRFQMGIEKAEGNPKAISLIKDAMTDLEQRNR